MKRLLFSTLLTAVLALTASADGLVTGKSYRLAAPDNQGTLTEWDNMLSLTVDAEGATTFVAEVCGEGFVLRSSSGNYVLRTPAGEALQTGPRYAETLPAPRAYTILASGSEVMLRDKQTGLQLNTWIYGNGNGAAALHTGTGDASQWRILPVDADEAIDTSPAEGTDYYLQSRMNAKLGWYAYNDNGQIKLKQTADEACRFRFVATGTAGEWYIHHVATDTEITGGAQGQPVSLAKTSTLEAEDLAQVFTLAESLQATDPLLSPLKEEDNVGERNAGATSVIESSPFRGDKRGSGGSGRSGGLFLQALGQSLYLGLTDEGLVSLTAEPMAWAAELILFPNPDTYYNIVSKKNSQACMTEEKTGAVVTKGASPAVRCYWQFVPTGRENCFYIKNATTGRYIGSTNMQPSSNSKMTTQDEPVEFFIGKNTTAGTATEGAYYFSSTDCANYDFATAGDNQAPRAMNLDGASSNVIVWQAKQGDAGSYWLLEPTDYLYNPNRSDFARRNGIYQLPCGAKGQNHIEALTIDRCAIGMNYPRAIAQADGIGSESAEPATWYTLFTADKATVEQGQSLTLSLTLKNAPQPGDELFAYFDWDGDGVFEAAHTLENAQSIKKAFSVPVDARPGKTRLRLRLTANGLDEAEDDVVGQTLDLVLNVVEEFGESPRVEVEVNAKGRGQVSVAESSDDSHAVTVKATPLGNATFVCWKEGNQVRSVEPTYTFTPVNLLTRLTAVFTPNTDMGTGLTATPASADELDIEVTATGRHLRVMCPATLCEVSVYTPSGALVTRAEGLNPAFSVPAAGTYIVKVKAPAGRAAKKVTVK